MIPKLSVGCFLLSESECLGEARMAVGPSSCQGHQVRQDTAAKIRKEKQTPPKVIDSNMKIYIKKGGKHGTEIKLMDLNGIVRARKVEKGNWMVVPSVKKSHVIQKLDKGRVRLGGS